LRAHEIYAKAKRYTFKDDADAGEATPAATSLDPAALDSITHDLSTNAFVMFHTPGCPAVEHMLSELHAVARAFRAHRGIVVAHLDADAHPAAAARYAAHGLPAIVFFGQALLLASTRRACPRQYPLPPHTFSTPLPAPRAHPPFGHS
jgi:thioredoxin-like negative regulator of GroEL